MVLGKKLNLKKTNTIISPKNINSECLHTLRNIVYVYTYMQTECLERYSLYVTCMTKFGLGDNFYEEFLRAEEMS